MGTREKVKLAREFAAAVGEVAVAKAALDRMLDTALNEKIVPAAKKLDAVRARVLSYCCENATVFSLGYLEDAEELADQLEDGDLDALNQYVEDATAEAEDFAEVEVEDVETKQKD